MKAYERIRIAREAPGLTEAEVAIAIGLNLRSYFDLESDPHEVYSCVSLGEIQALSRTLNVDPIWIVTGERTQMESDIGLLSVPALIRKHLLDKKMTDSHFSTKAGWEVGPVLSDEADIWEWSLDELKDVCRVLRIDWKSVLPRRERQVESF